ARSAASLMPHDTSRRQFLLHSLTGLSAAWVSANWPALLDAAQHAHQQSQSAAPKLEFFTAAEAAEIDAISSRIIPADDTPGAHEAGVVYFIDRTLASFARDAQSVLRDGLPHLQSRASELFPGLAKFSAATPEQQDEILRSFDDQAPKRT